MELQPCPFCGGTKLKIDSKRSSNFRFDEGVKRNHHVVTVRCNKCHCKSPTVSVWLEDGRWNAVELMREAAAERWNKRE